LPLNARQQLADTRPRPRLKPIYTEWRQRPIVVQQQQRLSLTGKAAKELL
jgi:hypothetical protein